MNEVHSSNNDVAYTCEVDVDGLSNEFTTETSKSEARRVSDLIADYLLPLCLRAAFPNVAFVNTVPTCLHMEAIFGVQ